MKVAGHYIRTGGGGSAELRLTKSMTALDRYHVEGLALWGEARPGGPNTGTLEFTADLEGNSIRYSSGGAGGHRVALTFTDGELAVEEVNAMGEHGMNVTFDGLYRRAGPVVSTWRALRLALVRLVSR